MTTVNFNTIFIFCKYQQHIVIFLLFKRRSFLKHLTKSDIVMRSNALDGDINIGNWIHNKG